jgi:hypothetical protein
MKKEGGMRKQCQKKRRELLINGLPYLYPIPGMETPAESTKKSDF